jgi:hypothetical protein
MLPSRAMGALARPGLICLLVCIEACASPPVRPPDLPLLKSAPPAVEALVSAAVSDRFRAGDIPDQNLVTDGSPVYLFNELERSGYQLGPAALPKVPGLRFAQVNRTEARDLAYGRGGLWMVEVDDVEIAGERAHLTIGVLAYPDVTKDAVHCGGQAEAEFRRRGDGAWEFVSWGPTLWGGW